MAEGPQCDKCIVLVVPGRAAHVWAGRAQPRAEIPDSWAYAVLIAAADVLLSWERRT
jgi:hypothetical protein